MTDPLVHCAGCDRAWHSPTMVNGLRLVGSCPRCGGELVYAQAAPTPEAAEPAAVPDVDATPDGGIPPHLVLGVPRR